MRLSAIAGVFACTAIIAAVDSPSVSAQSISLLKSNTSEQITDTTDVLAVIESAAKQDEEPKLPPKPVTHEVKVNETLSLVAEQHKTSWKRIFDKNEQLAHPDQIKPGDKLVIPGSDEVLKDRPLPTPTVIAVGPVSAQQKKVSTTPARISRGSQAGNSYSPGYCTWYAKNMRPDLPNNLGNANTWVARAAAMGYATGSAPRAGAIGQQGMHVVYVERVNGDGTVTISEMNYNGLYVVSSRTVSAGTFSYIY